MPPPSAAGRYSDPKAAAYLAEILIARRDAIGRAYLPAITPLADFAFDPATGVSFVNVAERAKVAEAPADGYRAQWLQVDNATGAATPIGGEVRAATPLVPAPARLPEGAGAVLAVKVWAVDAGHPAWTAPVEVSFMRGRRRLAPGRRRADDTRAGALIRSGRFARRRRGLARRMRGMRRALIPCVVLAMSTACRVSAPAAGGAAAGVCSHGTAGAGLAQPRRPRCLHRRHRAAPSTPSASRSA